MEAINWSADLALGVAALDDAHKALLEQLGRLSAAPDAQFAAGFVELVALIERDFREEEELMENINFPALHNHREQHARVLGGLHHLDPYAMQGDVGPGRKAIELLPQWFLYHLKTADAALAGALEPASQP